MYTPPPLDYGCFRICFLISVLKFWWEKIDGKYFWLVFWSSVFGEIVCYVKVCVECVISLVDILVSVLWGPVGNFEKWLNVVYHTWNK